MNRNTKPAPEWKAPDTLLPKVMAAVAHPNYQTASSMLSRIFNTIVTAGLCVIVAVAGGILLGFIPDPLASLTGLAQPATDLWNILSIFDRTATGLIHALISNKTSAIALGIYGIFMLCMGLCSIRGLVYLFNSTSYSRRHSV